MRQHLWFVIWFGEIVFQISEYILIFIFRGKIIAECFSSRILETRIVGNFWAEVIWKSWWKLAMKKHGRCFVADPEPAGDQLLGDMAWCCPPGVAAAALLMEPNMSAHKDNSGLHVHVGLLSRAPLKWSDMMFAQMWGSGAERPDSLYPSGGPGPPQGEASCSRSLNPITGDITERDRARRGYREEGECLEDVSSAVEVL